MSVTDLEEEIPGLDAEGRPDPAYAENLGLVAAGWGARSTAFVIDMLLLALFMSPLGFGVAQWVGSGPSGQIVGPMTTTITILLAAGGGLGLACVVVQTAVHGRRGATLGKSILGLRSVDVAQFGRIGFGRALKRVLVLLVSSVVVVIGPYLLLISGVWDRERRGRSVLDRVARCWVVDTRDGIDPFDARALRRARRALNVEAVDTEEDLLDMATGSTCVPRFVRSKAGVIGAGGVGSTWEEMGDQSGTAPAHAVTAPPDSSAAPRVQGQSAAVAGEKPPTTPPGRPAPARAAAARPVAAGPVPPGPPRTVAPAAQASVRTTVTAPAASAPAPAPAMQALAPPVPSALVGASTSAVRPAARPVPVPTGMPPGDSPSGQAQSWAPSGAGVTLVFDGGERFGVEQFALIGRAPRPQPGDPPGRLVVVDDTTGEMSKTHAEIRAAGGAWWITDRGSSNGTTIHDPDGRTVALKPGQREPLRQGTRVRLGGRTLEVHRGAS